MFFFCHGRDQCSDDIGQELNAQFESTIESNVQIIHSNGQFIASDKPYILVRSGADQSAKVKVDLNKEQLKALKYMSQSNMNKNGMLNQNSCFSLQRFLLFFF